MLASCLMADYKSVSGEDWTLRTYTAPGYLRVDGSLPLTANWDIGAFSLTGLNFISDVATGTSPYACTSTTVNANLNADLWDGYQFADYLDQAVKQASSPTFAGLTISTDGKAYLRDTAIGIYSQADTYLDLFSDGGIRLGDSAAGAPTNYAQFAPDGLLTFAGTGRVKREFTIQAVNLDKGSLGPDAVILGNTLGYSYDVGDDSVLSFEIPYDCDTSADIKIEIYWYINEAYATGSGEVQWLIDWSACPATSAEAIDAPTHTGSIDFNDQDIPATAKYLTEKSGTIAAASIADGDFVSMTLYRVAADDGNAPTADPVIVQVEVEYTSNKLGEAL